MAVQLEQPPFRPDTSRILIRPWILFILIFVIEPLLIPVWDIASTKPIRYSESACNMFKGRVPMKNSLLAGVSGAVIVFCLIASAYGHGISKASAATTSPCDRLSSQNFLSPGGDWEANINNDLCEGGYVFDTYATYAVELISIKHPKKGRRVFLIDDCGNSCQPAIQWTGRHELKITTRRSLYIGIQEAKYEDIAVSYVLESTAAANARTSKHSGQSQVK